MKENRKKRALHLLLSGMMLMSLCPVNVMAEEEKTLICTKEEHTHTEECYQDGELICQKEEHTHTDECYEANTQKTITTWSYNDTEEYLSYDETGNGYLLALGSASEENKPAKNDIIAMLPSSISALINEETQEISIFEWTCDNYPETEVPSGNYTFTAVLPEGYAFSDPSAVLTVIVSFGDVSTLSTNYQLSEVWNETDGWTAVPAKEDIVIVDGIEYYYQSDATDSQYIYVGDNRNTPLKGIWKAGNGYVLLNTGTANTDTKTMTFVNATMSGSFAGVNSNSERPIETILIKGNCSVDYLTVTTSTSSVTFSGDGSLTADSIACYGNNDLTVESGVKLNALVIKDSSNVTVYGNAANSCEYLLNSLTVQENAVLTVGETPLRLDSGCTLTNNGTIINNGKIMAVDGTLTDEQAKSLSATGTVEIYSDNQFTTLSALYQNGTKLFIPSGTTLDFTGTVDKPGTLEEDGYHWDSTANTLTLSNLYFPEGTIILPDGAKLVSAEGSENTIYDLKVNKDTTTISGKGKLIVKNDIGTNQEGISYSLTIDGADVEVKGTVNNGNTDVLNNALSLVNGANLTAGYVSWPGKEGVSVSGESKLNATGDGVFTNLITLDDTSEIYTHGGVGGYSTADYTGIVSYLPEGYSIYAVGANDRYIQDDATGEKAKDFTIKYRKTPKISETSGSVKGLSVEYGTKSSTFADALKSVNANTTFVDPDDAGTIVGGILSFTLPEDIAEIPSVGSNYEASWKFIPTDGDTYNSVKGTVKITVTKANDTLTFKDDSGSTITELEKTYGDSSFIVKATGAESDITVTYTSSDNSVLTVNAETGEVSIHKAGTATITATRPESENYYLASTTLGVTVNKADQPAVEWPSASSITYGQTLSQSELSGGSTSLGEFAWTDPTTVLEAGTQTASVTFTGNDQVKENYKTTTLTGSVNVTVNKAAPAVTIKETGISGTGDTRTVNLSAEVKGLIGDAFKAPSGTITFTAVKNGTTETITIGTADISDGEASITWGTAEHDSTYTVTATYNGDTDYTNISETLEVNTARTPQTITIDTIDTKTYGDAAFELNLSEEGSGSGAVTWTSSNESILRINGTSATIKGAGEVTIKAVKDSDDTYNQAEAEIELEINKCALTVTAYPQSKTYGESDPELTYTVSSLAYGDTRDIVFTGTITREAGEDVGSYAITQSTFTLSDSGRKNYTLAFNDASMTITAKNINNCTIADIADQTYTGSAITPALTVTDNAGTTVKAAGLRRAPANRTLTVNTDYTAVYADNINVGKATVTVTGVGNYTGTSTKTFNIVKASAPAIEWPDASDITYGQKLSQSTLSGGSLQYGTFAWTNPDSILEAGKQSAGVTFTANENTKANYETITETVKNVDINVFQAQPAVSVSASEIKGSAAERTMTLTANVNGVNGAAVPGGTVTFKAEVISGNGTALDEQKVDLVNGTAEYIWSASADTVYSVTVSYAGDTNYLSGTSGALHIDTARKNQSIKIAAIDTKSYGDGSFNLSLSKEGEGTGTVTWTSSNESILSIKDNIATIKGTGEVTIKAVKAADDTYNQAEDEIEIEIDKRSITITADNKTVMVSKDMPELTYQITSGELAEGDSFSKEPTVTASNDTSAVGTYVLTVSGAAIKNMNDEDVTANYSITYNSGILTVSDMTATPIVKGDTVRYIVEHYKQTDDGYELADTEYPAGKIGSVVTAEAKTYKGYTYNAKAKGSVISGTLKKITSKDDILTLKLYYDKTVYRVNIEDSEHGSVTSDPADAIAGTEITLTPTPDNGYHFKEWQVVSGGIEIKDNKFIMPESEVTIKAVFEKNAAGGGSTPSNSPQAKTPSSNKTDAKKASSTYIVPDTGDTSSLALWAGIMLIASSGAVIAWMKRKHMHNAE